MISNNEISRLLELDRYAYFKEGKPPLDSFYGSKGINKNNHFLLSKYFGPFSHKINRALRSGDSLDDFFILYEYLLNKTLKELPKNWAGTVYRMDEPGIDFSILKVWFQSRIGQVISFPNFLSTSKDRWKGRDIVFKITAKHDGGGRDVTKFSNNKNENEVLFRSRSKFRIVSVNEKDKYIGLKEESRNYSNVIIMDDSIYFNDDHIRSLQNLELENPNQVPSLNDLGLL